MAGQAPGSRHSTTGENHRDGHNLGAPQSSDAIHHVKSEQTSSMQAPPKPHTETGEGKGGGM